MGVNIFILIQLTPILLSLPAIINFSRTPIIGQVRCDGSVDLLTVGSQIRVKPVPWHHYAIALLREQYGMGTIEVRIMRPRPKLKKSRKRNGEARVLSVG